MSTHAIANETIKRCWLLAWQAGPLSAMPIEHENHRFKAPTDTPWGRLTLTRGDTSKVSLGGPTVKIERTPFILNLQVFIPENQGTRAADNAADAMAALNDFTASETNLTVNFKTVGIGSSSADKGAAFLITIPGQYDLTGSPGI